MASVVNKLIKSDSLQTPPSFLDGGMQLEVLTGSQSYDVSNNDSDIDVVGVVIPPKKVVFPHLAGKIQGFGSQEQKFDQFTQQHIKDPDGKQREYDIVVYSIVKYFNLCMAGNPNMIDSLFVRRRDVLYTTGIGELIRENRHLFLSKACWPKFKGYAFSQIKKARDKNPEGKRVAIVEKYGYDVKFAYHVVRLLDEVEQIMQFGDLDLTRSKEVLKAIRRGDWPLQKIIDYFDMKESYLESVYQKSNLPYKADESAIKGLLLKCLEEHYGSLDKSVVADDTYITALQDIANIVNRLP